MALLRKDLPVINKLDFFISTAGDCYSSMASLALKLKPTQGCQARQPILRVKTGCLTCRSRKKKCDETKPVCIGCERNGFLCEWPSRTTSSDRRAHKRRRGARSDQDTSSATLTSKDAHRHAVGGHHRPPSFDRRCTPDRGNTAPGTGTAGEQSTTTFSAHEVDWPLEELFSTSCDTGPSLAFESGQSSASTGSGRSPGTTASTVSPASSNVETEETQPTEYDPGPSDFGGFNIINTKSTSIADRRPVISSEENFALDLSMAAFAVESTNASLDIVPASMPLLSDTQGPTYDLLSFYISRTARSMGNGSTETNPFVSQLIPLAFANKFILGLVLCQSAVHRATEDSSQFAVAQTYYNKSLRSFRQSIDEYISGQEVSPLWLALGALIMCFTETAKGDLHGSIFDHIEAAGPLLSRLMTHSANLPNDLKNFIVEYYVDLVTISMISVDPSFGSTLVLDSQFEVMAEAMVKDGYVGQLCGTWLELLLLVPRIFDFARLSTSTIAADRFIVFSDLQSRIVSFTPSAPSPRIRALWLHLQACCPYPPLDCIELWTHS
uniref:Zn(2)-C6 fungal-type domain-containing protein n=1 Tax=Bionectria ochroleuca TaxID=29856 RepID=A0A8H7K1E1_BIOOC